MLARLTDISCSKDLGPQGHYGPFGQPCPPVHVILVSGPRRVRAVSVYGFSSGYHLQASDRQGMTGGKHGADYCPCRWQCVQVCCLLTSCEACVQELLALPQVINWKGQGHSK